MHLITRLTSQTVVLLEHNYHTINLHDSLKQYTKTAKHGESKYSISYLTQPMKSLTFTMREQREKNSDEMTAMKSPTWGRAHAPLGRTSATSCCGRQPLIFKKINKTVNMSKGPKRKRGR